MTSRTQICNLALSWLGAKFRIASTNDGSVSAQACEANYDYTRDSTLEDGRWTFATKRAVLPALEEAPAWGFNVAFELPSDCLTVLEARDNTRDDTTNTLDWQREGNQIVALDAANAYIRYICRIEDESRFPPLFVQAFAARLAADMAVTLTGSRAMQSDMWGLYERKMDVAVNSDSLQGRSQIIRANRLKQVRRVNWQ